MDVFERANGFQFDHDLFFDEKIQTMLANLVVFIEKRNLLLTDELNSTQANSTANASS